MLKPVGKASKCSPEDAFQLLHSGIPWASCLGFFPSQAPYPTLASAASSGHTSHSLLRAVLDINTTRSWSSLSHWPAVHTKALPPPYRPAFLQLERPQETKWLVGLRTFPARRHPLVLQRRQWGSWDQKPVKPKWSPPGEQEHILPTSSNHPWKWLCLLGIQDNLIFFSCKEQLQKCQSSVNSFRVNLSCPERSGAIRRHIKPYLHFPVG